MAVGHDDDEYYNKRICQHTEPCRNIFEEKCSYQNGNFSQKGLVQSKLYFHAQDWQKKNLKKF
jgi:hypothetical protein